MKLLLTMALLASAATAQPAVPPPPARPRPFLIPPVVERTLENGLRVIVAERKHSLFCSFRLVFRTGASDDPEDLSGLASATFTTLGDDTNMAADIEALGASYGWSTLHDSSWIAIDALRSAELRAALSHVAEGVTSRAFNRDDEDDEDYEDDEKMLNDFVRRRKDTVRSAMTEPELVASLVAPRVVFRNAYRQLPSGSLQSLDRITTDDVGAFRAAHVRPDNAILVIAGGIRPWRAFAIAAKAFGQWKPVSREPLERREIIDEPPVRRVVVVDIPTAAQAAVVVGRPALRRADPAYDVSLVADAILGDGSSSRLFRELRVKRGLSYAPSAWVTPRRGAGPFYASAQTKNESAAEVAGLIVDELEKFARESPEDAELRPRRAALAGQFYRSIETTAGIVEHLSSLAVYGIPLEQLGRHVERIGSVSATDVQRYAARHLAPAGASIIVAGDAQQFVPALRERFGPGVEIIQGEELDLDLCCN